MATITHGSSLPDSADKSDFYAIIDGGSVSDIVNADIAAGAAIADSKLATISTANKVKTSAISDENLDVADLDCDDLTAGSVVVDANGGVAMKEGTAPSTAAGTGALYTKDTGGQPELFYREESDGDEIQITSGGALASGTVVQKVNTIVVTSSANATTIPQDDSIPTYAEGSEYMTLAITPTSATNELIITVVLHGCNATNGINTVALFQDGEGTDAAIAVTGVANGVPEGLNQFVLVHKMTAGTTSETTFQVRAGGGAGTFTFNGTGSNRLYGGVLNSSITIEEIVP